MEDSGHVHICQAGETFDSVALVEYHDGKYTPDLLCMNPELCRKSVFTGGEVLRLPVVEVTESELDDEADYSVPQTAPWKE